MARQRVTVKEAAETLGLSVEAIRKRIERGHLESVRVDNRVYVYLDTDQTESAKDRLINSLQDQVEYLRLELSRRAAEHAEEMRRKDHLLAAALERIPAIEPPADVPPDARESSVTASEEEGKGQVPPEPETAESEPWWRRIFK